MSQKLAFLDLARGIAAILVLAGHLRSFVFVDYPDVVTHNPLIFLFYAMTGLGHQAVMVFFVLSGFLIGRSIQTASNEGRWTWKRYAVQRLTRLWIVLIPALILTALLDKIGSQWVQADFYSGALRDRFNSGPTGRADWSTWTFAANTLFLQTIVTPTFGSNGPLWSLANEFWYYVLFPLAFFGIRGGAALQTRLLHGLAFVGISLWLPFGLVMYGAIWLLGYAASMAAVVAARSRVTRSILHIIGPILLLTALLYARVTHSDSGISDALVGIAFAVWIVPLSLTAFTPGIFTRIVSGLADMSYTLYLTHFPFVALVTLSVLHTTKLRPDALAFAAYALIFLLAMAFAIAVWWAFERRTKKVQSVLLAAFQPHRLAL